MVLMYVISLFKCTYVYMYLCNRQINASKGLPFNLTKLIILLVDQQIFLKCSDISTSTSNISVVACGN